MNYSYEDVPKTDWDNAVWRAAKLGQQSQLRLHFVGSEQTGATAQRVYYFTPPVGTVTLDIAKSSHPACLEG